MEKTENWAHFSKTAKQNVIYESGYLNLATSLNGLGLFILQTLGFGWDLLTTEKNC